MLINGEVLISMSIPKGGAHIRGQHLGPGAH